MRWTLKPEPSKEQIERLSSELKVTALIAKLLLQRGIENFEMARKFFRPQLSDLHDPFLMKDMEKAVQRILVALKNEERILVFGDYDVDGTTAVSLVYSYLSELSPYVTTYIPDRYKEGYGISRDGIDFANDNGCTLVIALDCGIKSVDHIAYAKSLGIDFIICDHHRPGERLPDAVAVLDPKREDCFYPYDELCGCGIGFKLIQALGQHFGHGIEVLYPYLDLVATAIAADIVPITGENRVLAFFGMRVINDAPRCGIRALTAGIKKREITISDVVFVLAPRINAAGRIRHGSHAVALLTESDEDEARKYAREIDLYNQERKALDEIITAEAIQQIYDNREAERFTTVVYHEDWHKGVIGIVASRLIERFYRPTLVFTKSGDFYAASARSVKGFDVYNALQLCAEYLEQFGGHMYAAGMTIKEENYPAFKDAFERVVSECILPEQRAPEILVDAEISLSEIDGRFLRILKQFEPFGPGNEMPVFLSRSLFDTGYAKPMGNGRHLRGYFRQYDSGGVGAVGFGLGEKLSMIAGRKQFDAVYHIEENEFNGRSELQLRLKDIRQTL